MQQTARGRWVRLAVVTGAVLAVEWMSAAVTLPSIPVWYASLAKPAWNPPNGVFGPVWGVLYVMIALAGWRIWEAVRAPHAGRWHPACAWYMLQLTANLAWSVLFFGLNMPRAALADILLLDAAIIGTMRAAWPLSRAATWLLAPYLLWVLYATTLNGAIVWLNP